MGTVNILPDNLNEDPLPGSGGVELAARSFTVRGKLSGIFTGSVGQGRAGPLRIASSNIQMFDGIIGSIPIRGDSGAVTVSADRLTMDKGVIGVPSDFPVVGASAGTTVEVREALNLRNGASINSSTFGRGTPAPYR